MTKLISHRGNVKGPDPDRENNPFYILDALSRYDVEVDVWFIGGKFMLGHDKPEYDFPKSLMEDNLEKLWLHCKNVEAFNKFSEMDPDGDLYNYFWHEEDVVIFTSKGYRWVYPGKQPIVNSIAVMPELYNDDTSSCIGICSDYVSQYL